MAQVLTVDQLLEECKRVKKAGHGNKKILIPSDDEGNSYHELFGLFSLGYYPDNEQLPFGVSGKNVGEYVVLG